MPALTRTILSTPRLDDEEKTLSAGLLTFMLPAILPATTVQAKYLKRLLEKHAYQVSVTHDGEEALAAIRRHRPTLVVSDIVMPRMDGFELCHE